jgi:hypothetical protein
MWMFSTQEYNEKVFIIDSPSIHPTILHGVLVQSNIIIFWSGIDNSGGRVKP